MKEEADYIHLEERKQDWQRGLTIILMVEKEFWNMFFLLYCAGADKDKSSKIGNLISPKRMEKVVMYLKG